MLLVLKLVIHLIKLRRRKRLLPGRKDYGIFSRGVVPVHQHK
jgi:hypothetical protein